MFIHKIATYFPITDPTWIFFVVLCIILFAPMILEKLKLPAIIGMIFAGVLIGPHGIHLLNRDSSFELFGKVGLYYIMFLASLEMNLQDVKKSRVHALTFGLMSFLFPIAVGFAANFGLLGYSAAAAMLMAAMYASHTLITYPIVIRYGLSRQQSVNIAVGGTIVADTLTLLVLAVVGGTFKDNVTGWYWVFLVIKVIILGLAIVYLFPRMGRWFFRRYNEAVVQYVFVLGLVFLGAGLMEWVGIDGILGAFLVGIVLNRLIPPGSPLMNHIEFVGNALFIPYLLIGVGMIIDVKSLFTSTETLVVSLVMIAVSISMKWFSAFTTQKLFRMKVQERNLLFGLTNSRAAATLAVVIVGHNIMLPDGSRLLDETVLNSAMILILVSCVVSSIVTERTSRKLALMAAEPGTQRSNTPTTRKMLIAISNPQTVEPLMGLTLMMRHPKAEPPIVALNIVLENEPEAREKGARQLELAADISAAAGVTLQTQSRWSVNVVSGIYHTMMETDATELIMGLHQKTRITETYYGKLVYDLLGAIKRQIIIYRPGMPLNTIRMIHIVVQKKAEYEAGFARWTERMAQMAERLGCRIILHGGEETLEEIARAWKNEKFELSYTRMELNSWSNMLPLANTVNYDHLLVFVCARPGTLSHHSSQDLLPEQLERYFSGNNLLLIYPDQYEAETNKL